MESGGKKKLKKRKGEGYGRGKSFLSLLLGNNPI